MYDREWLWYQMTAVCGIGARTIRKIIEYAGSLEEAVGLSTKQLEASHICSVKMLEGWEKARLNKQELYEEFVGLRERGIIYISIEHELYPSPLKNLQDAPLGLWVKGDLPKPQTPSAAIIGSRGCTPYGKEIAAELGKKLSSIGVNVISGMAVGIDSSAQWGAVNAGGYSLGILGGGVDVCYPRENIELYERLLAQGGIMSESPPKNPPLAPLFRLRNRLISGMADCVIVVEARERSGTQITVNCALDQGREIFALPGRITDPLSRGCNVMISQGARILWDFSELAGFFHADTEELKLEKKSLSLTGLELSVYNSLGDEPKHFEEILHETGITVAELMETLLHLEIKGAVHQQIKNYYRRSL